MDPSVLPQLEDLAQKLYCSGVPAERQLAEKVQPSFSSIFDPLFFYAMLFSMQYADHLISTPSSRC